MTAYIVKRLAAAVPVVAGVIAVVFILTSVIPGDAARVMVGERGSPETVEKIRQDLELDKPLWVRFCSFFRKAVTFDLGKSYRNNMPVTTVIAARIPTTAKLAVSATLIAVVMGICMGIVSAVKQHSFFDYVSMFIAVLGISAPVFWTGLLLVLLFCVQLGWIPGTGTGDGSWRYLLLPAVTLGIRPAALIARLTRSSMLEVIGSDYIITARAKGLSEMTVIYKHALKNAMIPVVTVIGIQTAYLLSGTIIIEMLFSLPGLGQLFVQAINSRDLPVIQGIVLFMALTFVFINLIVDLSYPIFDARIRYDGRKRWRA